MKSPYAYWVAHYYSPLQSHSGILGAFILQVRFLLIIASKKWSDPSVKWSFALIVASPNWGSSFFSLFASKLHLNKAKWRGHLHALKGFMYINIIFSFLYWRPLGTNTTCTQEIIKSCKIKCGRPRSRKKERRKKKKITTGRKIGGKGNEYWLTDNG